MTSFPRAIDGKLKDACIISGTLIKYISLREILVSGQKLKVFVSIRNSHQMTLMTLLIDPQQCSMTSTTTTRYHPTPHQSTATTANIFLQYRWCEHIVALRRHYLFIGRFSMLPVPPNHRRFNSIVPCLDRNGFFDSTTDVFPRSSVWCTIVGPGVTFSFIYWWYPSLAFALHWQYIMSHQRSWFFHKWAWARLYLFLHIIPPLLHSSSC